MATRYVLAVHDLNGKRLCTLFDSEIPQMGAAYNIVITKQIASGWKEISFNLSKYDNNGDRNWRWDFIRNENHLYLYEDDSVDKFSIKAPTDLHDSNKVQFTVKANHIAEELKTRNLYGYFDDDNGIGTIAELVHLALAGTGWSLVTCDTLYEKDGVTEKVRSYSCDTKTGAYNMISGLCDLFNAHPVFNGNRTVEIYSNDNTNGYMEILFGKNSNSISRVQNSESLVTRLYVEGEYGNYGYVGIDDVNPTGLPFILNFDYYRDLGLFTNEHQAAVDTYLEDYKDIVDTISGKQSTHNTKNGELITLIGTCAWLRYPVVNGQPDRDSMIEGGVIPDDTDISLQDGDKVAAVKTNGEYEHIEYSTSASSDYSAYAYLIKFYPVILGKIATEEDMESAKQNNIDSLMTSMNKFLRKNDYTQYETVAALKTAYGVADLRIVDDDDFDVSGLPEGLQQTTTRDYAATIGENEAGIMSLQTARYDDMRDAVSLMSQVHTLETEIDNAKSEQAEIEETFVTAMGALLRDGYWSDTNYVPGQEQSLYNDALEISEKVGKPTVTYTISTQDLSVLPEYEGEDFCVGQSVRIYDAETGLNDYAIVSEQKIYPDKPKSNSITLKTDLLDIGTKTFATTIERITELANTLKQNKEKYERAQVISRTGSVPVSVLEGAVDVLTNRLTSVSSNWATDEKGNILLTSLDGTSAMMLCGGGFMVANSKNPDGSWEWRTFGTGDGFTADMITTGFLSADRIQAYTITVDHLSSDVGTSLDLSSNNSIQLIVDDLEGDISQVEQTANKITWIVSSGTSSANMTLTNDFLSATAENIDLSANSTIMTAVENDEGYSQVAQNSNKITWIVQSGSSSSNMELTDDFYAVTAENIDLTANEGFTTTVAGLQSGIDAATETITTQQTQIVQLQESLSLKAEQTEVTEIEERVTAAEEKITPEAIFSTVSSQLSVGSRNYIKYSRSFIKNDNGDMVTDHNYVMRNINAHVDAAWADYSNVYESGGDDYSAGSGTKAIENVISPTGEYDEVLQLANASDSLFRIDVMDHSSDSAYCFSIWGKRADTATEDVDVLFSILGHCEIFTMTEEWQRFSVLIEPPYESESIDITTESDEAFFLYKGMLEQGNVVTDWIQAPEDNFESLSSLVEQTDRSWKASINERLGTSGNLSTYMKFTANGLVFGVQTTSGTSSYYSKFQIVINNEAIRFYDFSDYDPKDIPDMSNEAYWQEEEIYKPVAYITSKELYITTASITTGMKVGDYTIMDDGDGGFAIV